MNQERIGQFIQNLRKEKGLTQKELADSVGISDKTVSKWETGNGLPDISVLLPLCQALGINVNELLSGEKLPPQAYSEKAEVNMFNLLKENEETKKSGRKQTTIGAAILFISVITFIRLSFAGAERISLAWYLDLPSLLFLVLPSFGLLMFSGARGREEIIGFLLKILPPLTLVEFLFMLVVVLGVLSVENTGALGPNLAVCILTPLYAAIAYTILLMLKK